MCSNKVGHQYLLSICFLLLVSLQAHGKEDAVNWYLAPVVSGIKGDEVRPSGNDYGVGLGFGARLNSRWASELYASGNTLYASDGASHFYQRGVSLDNFFYLYSRPRYEFYGVAALGGLRTTYLGKKTVNFMSNAGLGIQVPVTQWGLALRSDIRYRFDNDRKSMALVQKGFADWVFNIGLSVPLGTVMMVDSSKRVPAGDLLSQSNDADQDGVADIIDLCRQTPKDAAVDSRGCEFDTDGDGIVDSRDQCADSTPVMKVNAQGCEFDSDGDGLADSKDSCPESTIGAEVDALGCEAESLSPFAANSISMINPVEPINVTFDLSSASLDQNARENLSELAAQVLRSDNISVVVTGHTDITGNVVFNKELAQQRAKAVTQYLIASGIPSDRVRIDARGPFEPVATNKTESGRAKNRRVELYLVNN